MGGRLISSDDPEANRAAADLEGSALNTAANQEALASVPARLPPLQRAAWWTLFGAFALASTGGVFAGLAESESDRARRYAITIDNNTGSQLVYSDIKSEYEATLRAGRRNAVTAQTLLVVSGVTLVSSLTLFIVHAVRHRKASKSAARRRNLRPTASGFEVQF